MDMGPDADCRLFGFGTGRETSRMASRRRIGCGRDTGDSCITGTTACTGATTSTGTGFLRSMLSRNFCGTIGAFASAFIVGSGLSNQTLPAPNPKTSSPTAVR